jgi:hypothetical protein
MPETLEPIFRSVVVYVALEPSRRSVSDVAGAKLRPVIDAPVTIETAAVFCVTTIPFTTRSNSNVAGPGMSVPVPAVLLEATIMLESVHAPFGRTPEPLPH